MHRAVCAALIGELTEKLQDVLWENTDNVPSTIELESDDYDYLKVITNMGTTAIVKKGTNITLTAYNRPNGLPGGTMCIYTYTSDLTYTFASCVYDFWNGAWVTSSGYLIYPILIMGMKK